MVIIIASVALIGLSVVQYSWLRESINTNREIFYQKVDLASNYAAERIQSDVSLLRAINYDLEKTGTLTNGTHQRISYTIDSTLRESNINTSFKYGIYRHLKTVESGFELVTGTATENSLIVSACNPKDQAFGWANISCSKATQAFAEPYHLGLFFPNESLYLLSRVKDSLITAFLFIIMLIGCFTYTIIVIRRQKKLSDMKNDFINNLTHEFKTPIFAIDLASGMLKKAPELQSSTKLLKYAEVIDSESKRLRSQVDKVLQMALVDSGNFKLEKKQLDIHELIIKVIKNFEVLIKERQGEIKLNLNAKKTMLFADETHLKNILYNLLDNAQKYSRTSPQIIINTEDTSKGLSLSIQDNGIGIKEDIQRYIFNKFYRADTGDVHDVKGFGLGLSYVKSVIDAHQATIELVSQPNLGSKFTVQFST